MQERLNSEIQGKFCPLCSHELTENEKQFYPCSCKYQICLFCYKDINEKYKKICPNCKSQYDPNTPARNVSPGKRAELIKKEREKQREKLRKRQNSVPNENMLLKNLAKLQNIRIIQKELVYVIGLSPSLASDKILRRPEYFGQYGRIVKLVLNTHKVYEKKGYVGPSFSAYLTYATNREAAIAILSVDQFVIDDRMLRASFGTTKYCSHFLKAQVCPNKDCLYLHKQRTDCDTISKEDQKNNKAIFIEQQKIAFHLSGVENITVKEFMKSLEKHTPNTGIKSILPSPDIIYKKKFEFMTKIKFSYKTAPNIFKSQSPGLHSMKDPNSYIKSDSPPIENKISNNGVKKKIITTSRKVSFVKAEREEEEIKELNEETVNISKINPGEMDANSWTPINTTKKKVLHSVPYIDLGQPSTDYIEHNTLNDSNKKAKYKKIEKNSSQDTDELPLIEAFEDESGSVISTLSNLDNRRETVYASKAIENTINSGEILNLDQNIINKDNPEINKCKKNIKLDKEKPVKLPSSTKTHKSKSKSKLRSENQNSQPKLRSRSSFVKTNKSRFSFVLESSEQSGESNEEDFSEYNRLIPEIDYFNSIIERELRNSISLDEIPPLNLDPTMLDDISSFEKENEEQDLSNAERILFFKPDWLGSFLEKQDEGQNISNIFTDTTIHQAFDGKTLNNISTIHASSTRNYRNNLSYSAIQCVFQHRELELSSSASVGIGTTTGRTSSGEGSQEIKTGEREFVIQRKSTNQEKDENEKWSETSGDKRINKFTALCKNDRGGKLDDQYVDSEKIGTENGIIKIGNKKNRRKKRKTVSKKEIE